MPTLSLLDLLIDIHQRLDSSRDWHHVARTVKFMSYEVVSLSHGCNEEKMIQNLNQFFFEQKDFKIGDSSLLNILVESRSGCSILLSLLYMELSAALGLKMQLMHWPPHTTLRWESSGGKLRYLDLAQKGHELSHDEILALLCRKKDQMRVLSESEAFQQYLNYLMADFRNRNEKEQLHNVLNFILALEPENTRYLAERALLRKELGLIKDALQDMKRFFAFIEPNVASPEILKSYDDLKAMAPALS